MEDTMKAKILSLACAASSMLICGTSFAENIANDVNSTKVFGPVQVATGCNYSDYMLQLTNLSYHAQSCTVSCKHIVSRDNFSVYLHPHQTVNLYGTHSAGHCNMTCTDQYYGGMTSGNFDVRC